jgi:hypothetical protein
MYPPDEMPDTDTWLTLALYFGSVTTTARALVLSKLMRAATTHLAAAMRVFMLPPRVWTMAPHKPNQS